MVQEEKEGRERKERKKEERKVIHQAKMSSD